MTLMKSKEELMRELDERNGLVIRLEHELADLRQERALDTVLLGDDLNDLNKRLELIAKKDKCIHREYLKMQLENENMRLKLNNLNHDIGYLVSAFNGAKKTGRFEVNDSVILF